MKVLDPQSALLTTSEVHEFLLQHPPRAPPRKIGSYTPVTLKDYTRIREDFQAYVSSTVPYIAETPSATFINNAVPKLRALGLSKTEAYMITNLGLGLPRGQQVQQSLNGSQHVNGDAVEATGEGEQTTMAGEDQEQSFQLPGIELLRCVIEEWDSRFPGDEGQEQLQKILETLGEEYELVHATHATTNGGAGAEEEEMDVS